MARDYEDRLVRKQAGCSMMFKDCPQDIERKGDVMTEAPKGRDPAIRTIAMPADANANGDIFGGWMMAQMDLAGAVVAVRRAKGRIVTVAVGGMAFPRPVLIRDLVISLSPAETG